MPVVQESQTVKKTRPVKNLKKVAKTAEVSETSSEVAVAAEVPEVAAEVPEVAVASEVPEAGLEETFKLLIDSMNTAVKNVRTIEADMKKFKNLLQKELKTLNKKRKNKKSSGSKKSHGFPPGPVVPILAEFLGGKPDMLITRPQVTKAIANYVKENGLDTKENKSIFEADSTLQKLLGKATLLINPTKPELGYGYSYRNLQTYMVPLFIKAPKK